LDSGARSVAPAPAGALQAMRSLLSTGARRFEDFFALGLCRLQLQSCWVSTVQSDNYGIRLLFENQSNQSNYHLPLQSMSCSQ